MTNCDDLKFGPSQEPEYFDLIDLLKFVWKAKIFVCVGVVLGVAISLFLQHYFRPPIYTVQMPVKFDLLAARSESDAVYKFNQAFRKISNIEKVYDLAAGAASPEVLKTLEKIGWDKSKFSLMQSGSQGERKVPFSLIFSDAKLFLKGSYFARVDDASINLAFFEAFNDFSKENNKNAQLKISLASNPTETVVDKAAMQMETFLREKERVEGDARSKILALEAALYKKAGVVPGLVFDPDSDQTLRLIVHLKSAGKITEEEAQNLQENRVMLYSNFRNIVIRYSILSNTFQDALKKSSNFSSDYILGEVDFLPVLSFSEQEIQGFAKNDLLVKSDNRTVLFVLGGGIAGVLGSLFCYGLVIFLRRNLSRIMAIFSKNAH